MFFLGIEIMVISFMIFHLEKLSLVDMFSFMNINFLSLKYILAYTRYDFLDHGLSLYILHFIYLHVRSSYCLSSSYVEDLMLK